MLQYELNITVKYDNHTTILFSAGIWIVYSHLNVTGGKVFAGVSVFGGKLFMLGKLSQAAFLSAWC